jgi:SAM-dependent methyltransferase
LGLPGPPILKGGDGSGGADHVMPINILLLGITIAEHTERDPDSVNLRNNLRDLGYERIDNHPLNLVCADYKTELGDCEGFSRSATPDTTTMCGYDANWDNPTSFDIFADHQFDIIINDWSTAKLFPENFSSKIRRLLKPDGVIYMQDVKTPQDIPYTDDIEFSRRAISVILEISTKEEITVNIPPDATLLQFKNIIRSHIEDGLFNLMFAGKNLTDDTKTLAEYGIIRNSKVYLTIDGSNITPNTITEAFGYKFTEIIHDDGLLFPLLHPERGHTGSPSLFYEWRIGEENRELEEDFETVLETCTHYMEERMLKRLRIEFSTKLNTIDNLESITYYKVIRGKISAELKLTDGTVLFIQTKCDPFRRNTMKIFINGYNYTVDDIGRNNIVPIIKSAIDQAKRAGIIDSKVVVGE